MQDVYEKAEKLYHSKKANRNILFTQVDYEQHPQFAYVSDDV